MSLKLIFTITIKSVLVLLLASCSPAEPPPFHVAVASNFRGPANELVLLFQQGTEQRMPRSFGSTGKLYSQIKNGAPFDVFLAADAETPRKLEEEHFAVKGTRMTYAIGKLVLWSPDKDLIDSKGDDIYEASVFAQGSGYGFGVGICADLAGNDRFQSSW